MSIFNLRVCQNQGIIYIKSVQLNVNHDDSWRSDATATSLSLKHRPIWETTVKNQAHTILQVMQDKFRYADPEMAERAIDREEGPKYDYHVKASDGIHVMEANPVSYMLPFNPTLALDLLAAYAHFAAERKFDHIQFVNRDLVEIISNGANHHRRTVKAKQLYNLGQQAVSAQVMLRMLMEEIVKLDAIDPQYQTTVTAIKKILHYSSTHPEVPLINCLQGTLRASILLNVSEDDLNFTKEQTVAGRMRAIYAIARRLIADGLGSELTRLIHVWNEQAKINIYMRCIGRLTLTNPITFCWSDKYWEIFRTLAFIIRSDGRISIDLTNNPCYVAISMQTDFNLAIFTAELTNLFKTLELTLDQDIHLNGKFIFTKEASQKLIAAGLHYSPDYIAKLLRERNTASLFNQARNYSQDNKCGFYKMPRDVLNIIVDQSYLESQQGLLPEEKKVMQSLGLQKDPMAGLNNLFFQPVILPAEIIRDEHENKCVIC